MNTTPRIEYDMDAGWYEVDDYRVEIDAVNVTGSYRGQRLITWPRHGFEIKYRVTDTAPVLLVALGELIHLVALNSDVFEAA